MTDYRSLEELWAYRNEERVATLRRRPKGCEFRYTEGFLASPARPIALHLPKNAEGLNVEGMANLPPYFAGLLPEGVMFSAVRTLIGAAADDLFAVLAATGADAIGDIEVRVPGEPARTPSLSLQEAAETIESLLGNRTDFSFDALAAIPGVQPKLSLGELVTASRTESYIAKFDSPDFPGLIENEYAFMRLARRAKIDAAHVELRKPALLVGRFDRVTDPLSKAPRKIHTEDMLQVMDRFPNAKYAVEYGEIMEAMADLGVSKASLLDALRLYVFSYLIGNGDLHAKNVSLVFDERDGQWKLSPAYDLLSTLPYRAVLPGTDRMALALSDESYGRFSLEEFEAFGARFGLPEQAVGRMVRLTASKTIKHLSGIAGHILTPEVTETIRSRIEDLLKG